MVKNRRKDNDMAKPNYSKRPEKIAMVGTPCQIMAALRWKYSQVISEIHP